MQNGGTPLEEALEEEEYETVEYLVKCLKMDIKQFDMVCNIWTMYLCTDVYTVLFNISSGICMVVNYTIITDTID